MVKKVCNKEFGDKEFVEKEFVDKEFINKEFCGQGVVDKEFVGKDFVDKKFVVKESICIASLVLVSKGDQEFRRPGVHEAENRPGGVQLVARSS